MRAAVVGTTLLALWAVVGSAAARAGDPAPPPAAPVPRPTPPPGPTPPTGATGPPGATSAAPPPPSFGLDAPLLAVDRFSEKAATRLRRDRVPGLPGPNEPIHLDAPPFLVEVTGPGDRRGRCYDLDQRPARPNRFYVFYDRVGNYVLTQFPIVDVAPGDPGYSDLWDIWKVTVPDTFKPDNTLRDLAALDRLLADPASGYTAERTGALLNGPIVPEGSTALLKAEHRDGAAALRYAWYRGRRAPYLYFEQTLRPKGEEAPVSTMTLAGNASTPAPGGLAGRGPARVAALPGDPGYSPLHRLVAPDGRPLFDAPVNCPVVGP
jgi:hypothetical protein